MQTITDPKLLIDSINVVAPFIDPATGASYKVRALCEALTLTRKDLSTITGKSPTFFQDYWTDRFVKPSDDVVRTTIEQLLLLYVLTRNLFTSDAQVKLWLRLPNPAFENKTPASLIVDGKLTMVRDALITSVSGGIPA